MLTQECAHKASQKRSQEHKAYDLQSHALRQCTPLNVLLSPLANETSLRSDAVGSAGPIVISIPGYCSAALLSVYWRVLR